jgi:hypothetical protein
MPKRRSMLTACGAILGLVLAAASVKATTENRLMYLTFSGPVSLPGVTLGAGTYAFELADTSASLDIVRVRNRDRSQVYFMGFTNRVERPEGRRDNQFVSFGESQAGLAARILAWYPEGDASGHAFIYPKPVR